MKTRDALSTANHLTNSGRILVRCFIAILIVLAVLGLLFIWIVRSLPKITMAQLGQLTNTIISAGSLDLKRDGSVLIKNLTIRPRRQQQYDNTMLRAETVYARFSKISLLLLSPQLKEVHVTDFVFDAQYDLDTGDWNVAGLRIRVPGQGDKPMPKIELKGGTLRYSRISSGEAKVITSVPVEAEFDFAQQPQQGYNFNIKTATLSSGFGQSNLSGSVMPGKIIVTGGLSSTDIPAFEKVWAIDVLAAELTHKSDRSYSLKLRIKDFHSMNRPNSDTTAAKQQPAQLHADTLKLIESGISAGLPVKTSTFDALHRLFSRYQPSGTVDINIDASGNLDRLSESTLIGQILCKDVSFCDKKFPYKIEHVTGQIDFTENSSTLKKLSGKHGNVDVAIRWFYRSPPTEGQPPEYQIYVTSDNMSLDNELYESLSSQLKKTWDIFSPSGQAAIDYRVSRAGPDADSRSSLTVELLNAQATYRHFPYPLENLTGRIVFDRDGVYVTNVVSKTGPCKITVNGNVTDRDANQPAYYFSIEANDVPLDSTLAGALPAEQKELYNRFDMTGLADTRVKVFTAPATGTAPDPVGGRESYIADITLKKARLVPIYKFPLVVSDVSAGIVLTPDSLSVKKFTGQCNEGEISLNGATTLLDKSKTGSYYWNITARKIQLNDDLLGLVPKPEEKVFHELQPTGRVNLNVDLRKTGQDKQPYYNIIVDCPAPDPVGGDVSCQLAAGGPFWKGPLKNVTGKMTITNSGITLDNMAAIPARSESELDSADSAINLSGRMDLAEGALSDANFRLSARDIFPAEFEAALSQVGLTGLCNQFTPQQKGRCDLDFQNIELHKDQDGLKCVDFTGDIKFKDCLFSLSDLPSPAVAGYAKAGNIVKLNALASAKGSYKIGPSQTSDFTDARIGLLANSLEIKGKSITNLDADFTYNPQEKTWRCRHFIAELYGGRLIGSLQIGPNYPPETETEQKTPQYLLQAAFEQMDLGTFLSDRKYTSPRPDRGPEPVDPNKIAPPKADLNQGIALPTSGTVSGMLSIIAGSSQGIGPVQIGRCKLAVKNMSIGKLSPLARLLYVLNLTEPKDFAFEQMTIDSYIKRDRLLFKNFDLSGRAIAFSGSGWMDLKSDDVNLVLTARGTEASPSVLQSLAEGLGQAVVRMEVTGNVYDPQVTTLTLPVIKDSLKILGTPRQK